MKDLNNPTVGPVHLQLFCPSVIRAPCTISVVHKATLTLAGMHYSSSLGSRCFSSFFFSSILASLVFSLSNFLPFLPFFNWQFSSHICLCLMSIALSNRKKKAFLTTTPWNFQLLSTFFALLDFIEPVYHLFVSFLKATYYDLYSYYSSRYVIVFGL